MFELTEDPALLDEAVAAAREAVRATPPGHPSRFNRLACLNAALRRLDKVSGNVYALAERVWAKREMLSAVGHDKEQQRERMRGLAMDLAEYTYRTDDAPSLAEAFALIEAAMQAVYGGG